MTGRVTRRFVLSGLAAAAGAPAVANAPLSSPLPVPRGASPPQIPPTNLIREANLGGQVAYRVVNAKTGELIEEYLPRLRLPPASVAKAATSFYALSRLGAAHRFETALLATGPVSGGRIEGDLILRGGGDPVLDTDVLGEMIQALKAEGIHEVTGQFRIDASALPPIPYIDPGQPDHVGYNPAISGLNLNFNRVHFEWKRGSSGYELSMEARARRFQPRVEIARMAVADRRLPVYTYEDRDGIDSWTVARRALGKGGARWLPVKRPADYAAEVFMRLARSHGILLTRGPDTAGSAGRRLVFHESAPLSDILRDMLRYSTNLTAEAVGLATTQATGVAPESLIRSAREMNIWLNRDLEAQSCGFVDHSGLGYGARVSAADMVHILVSARRTTFLPAMLKGYDTGREGVAVRAKTGTLNFVSALAGYVTAPGAPELAFSILTADLERRDAVDPEDRERPPGAREWAGRSRRLQKALINRWVAQAAG